MISPEEAGRLITSSITILREDIARAKASLAKGAGGKTNDLVDTWLSDQGHTIPRSIDADSPGCPEVLANIARGFSLRLAFYQAVWELVASADIVPAACNERWTPSLGHHNRHGASGIPLGGLGCAHPQWIECPPFSSHDPADTDIFLAGIDSKGLHDGIREAIDQSLVCFRRSLYMPATVMLAAAAEATWTECGAAVGAKLSNAKLVVVISDQLIGIGKKVIETRKALEHVGAKQILKDAGQSVVKVCDAEVWTTVLRDRRNALHWAKAKSFVADHAGTANLLMAAQLHIGTLERIRAACQ